MRAEWQGLLDGRLGRGELSERYRALVENERLAIAQLGQSVDGFIATRTGDARFVTGPQDRRHLHRLRALVDAVVVGVNTVIADDPQLTVRDVDGGSPTRVVLDPHARAPRGAGVFQGGDVPTLWVVASGEPVPAPPGPGVTAICLPATESGFEPALVVKALAERGLRRILVEGGGVTVSRFVAAGAVDRLWITTAPLLLGDGVPGIRFEGCDQLSDAVRAAPRRFEFGDDSAVELRLR
ncbi:MAG: RibD family protein [Nocardioides sp.]